MVVEAPESSVDPVNTGRVSILYLTIGLFIACLGLFFTLFSQSLGIELLVTSDLDIIDFVGGLCMVSGVIIIIHHVIRLKSYYKTRRKLNEKYVEQRIDEEIQKL